MVTKTSLVNVKKIYQTLEVLLWIRSDEVERGLARFLDEAEEEKIEAFENVRDVFGAQSYLSHVERSSKHSNSNPFTCSEPIVQFLDGDIALRPGHGQGTHPGEVRQDAIGPLAHRDCHPSWLLNNAKLILKGEKQGRNDQGVNQNLYHVVVIRVDRCCSGWKTPEYHIRNFVRFQISPRNQLPPLVKNIKRWAALIKMFNGDVDEGMRGCVNTERNLPIKVRTSSSWASMSWVRNLYWSRLYIQVRAGIFRLVSLLRERQSWLRENLWPSKLQCNWPQGGQQVKAIVIEPKF